MRKADYSALADIIKHEREQVAKTARDFLTRMALDSQTEAIARSFARVASINKTEFLKACGIES